MGDQRTAIHPTAGLLRRFAVDWLDRADETVPAQIMAPGYTVHIGGTVLAGRAAYVEATAQQLAQFPGLTITVHEVLHADGGAAALRFTEHGASARGGAAAWRGIGLFWTEDGVLVRNVVEEDYLARRRQLLTGDPDTVDPPALAPWTEPVGAPDPAAEAAVRAWLANGAAAPPGLVLDDGRDGGPLLTGVSCAVTELFSADGRVAFHAVAHGRYAGGLPDAVAATGAPASLGVVGLVSVGPGGEIAGHVVRDRLGLRRHVQTREPG